MLARPARADTAALQVVTSFPEELTTRYEQEFENAHPGAHVQFIWKQGRDAIELLSRENQGGADVYWAPALNSFPLLRDRGAFQKISVDQSVLPPRLGEEQISDPSGYFEAYDVAGYGLVVNPALMKDRGLKTPVAWRDLADPAYAGQIVMPIASKVGYSPALYDIILQAEGWERGWALLAEVAANAELLPFGGAPTNVVKEAKAPIGLSIDFFALQARANGLPVDFIYPERTAFLPAHIAITAATRQPDLAKAFVDFLLSRQGQRLMMEADSSRHPARPDAYGEAPSVIVDPFKLPGGKIFAYESETIGRRRPGLVVTLFDIALTERHDKIVALWRAIRAAEAKARSDKSRAAVAEARRLAGIVPVSAQDADDPAFLDRFANRSIDPMLAQRWRSDLDAAQSKSRDLLASIGDAG